MSASLGAAKKQMVEIARAVRQNARVIIFDEPTATLTPEEKHHFFALLHRLKQRGVSIVFISHALEEALQISDRLTILRDGEMVVTDDTSEIRSRSHHPGYGRARLFRGELYRSEPRQPDPGAKVLSVQNLSMGSMVRNNSFSIYQGQIAGIFGLIGSGRTETAKDHRRRPEAQLSSTGEKSGSTASAVRYRVPRPAVKDGSST